MNSCSNTHLGFDKDTMVRNKLLQQVFLGNWISTCRLLKLDPYLVILYKYNSKCIKDLNIRPETLKLVQERAGNTLEAISISKDFLSRTQMAQQLRERIDKWDYVNLKASVQQKK
jgi:hypothetical protein